MTKIELQTQIRDGIIQLSRLAWAVSKLPESETVGGLIYKHNKILERLGNLQYDLDKLDIKACYYGFTKDCSGVPCAECNVVKGVSNDRCKPL